MVKNVYFKCKVFSVSFRLLNLKTLPGAAPGQWKLGGPIRETSYLGEDHDADVGIITARISFRTATGMYHVITYIHTT